MYWVFTICLALCNLSEFNTFQRHIDPQKAGRRRSRVLWRHQRSLVAAGVHRAPRPLISGHPCPSRTRDPVPELEGAAPTTGTAGTPHLWSRWVALKETRRDTRARRPGPEAAALMVLQARVPSSASRPRPAARLRKWGEGGAPPSAAAQCGRRPAEVLSVSPCDWAPSAGLEAVTGVSCYLNLLGEQALRELGPP